MPRAVVGERHKYVHYPYDTGELHDLSRDPWEMRNLIDEPDQKPPASELTAQLRRLMSEASDTKVSVF